jgi:hypothetical protein
MAKDKDTGSWAYQQANSKSHAELMLDISFTDFENKVKANKKYKECMGGVVVDRIGLQTQQS